MRRNRLLAMVLFFCLVFGVSWVIPAEAAEIAAPGNLSAVAVSASQINLTWTDKSSNESGFKIERKSGNSGFDEIAVVDSNTTFTDTSLAPNTTYTYRVRAFNSTGNSAYSNEDSATTTGAVPAAPSGLSAAAQSSSRINLTWEDNSSNETGFKIERKESGENYTQITTLGVNATSYEDTDLDSNTRYYYRVRAYNSSGHSAYSNEDSTTTSGSGAVPEAPSELSATAASASRINLTWEDNSYNETGFKIERKETGGSYIQVTTVNANSTSYEDTGLDNNTRFYYRVRAYNSSGNSAYSNEDSATTSSGAVPTAPSDLSATVTSYARIYITWEDNSNNETGFKIERKKAGGTYSQIDIVNANTTYYTDSDLAGDTRYYYRVRAYNAYGNSDYSGEDSAITSDGDVPEAPSDLSASALTSSRIRITWEDNSNNESGFKIERKRSGGTYSQIATLYANVTTYTDSSLSDDTRYYYRVRAYNAYGNSDYSDEDSAVTTDGDELEAPSDLSATALSSSRIKITWEDNSNNESGFKIERKRSGGTYSQITTVGANTTAYTNYSLDDNTRYYYRVRAYNAYGNSDYSDEDSAITGNTSEVVIKFYIGKSYYYVNDQRRTMDIAPELRESRTVLPIRYVAEALGASVTWKGSEEKVTITLKNQVIELWIGSNTARVNGQYKLIDSTNPKVTPFVLPPGRTMLPLRFIAETLGAEVDWNQPNQEVTVTYPAP